MDSEHVLLDEFVKSHPVEAALVLERLSTKEAARFLKAIPVSSATTVVTLLDPLTATNCLEGIENRTCAKIVKKLPIEISSGILRRLNKVKVESIFGFIENGLVKSLDLILQYPEDTAGALMDPQVFTIPDDINVAEALKRIRKYPDHIIYFVYVLNRKQILVGYLNIRQLMLARPNEQVSTIMSPITAKLNPKMNYKMIVANHGWREFHALPVVDEKGIFLGAIGYRTLRRLEEMGSDSELTRIRGDVGSALGELYWIGLSSIIKGASAVMSKEKDKTRE
jgi:magnesium transporter